MVAQVLQVLHAKPAFFWTLLINSCMAYAVNLTNFLVTKYTSALTLQVLGNMKGVIAAGISIAMFKNPVTAKGMIGYAITVGGVLAYSEVRPAGVSQACGFQQGAQYRITPAAHIQQQWRPPDTASIPCSSQLRCAPQTLPRSSDCMHLALLMLPYACHPAVPDRCCCLHHTIVIVQTKRRAKLRQIQEFGKTSSHPDMSAVIVKSIGGGDKEPLLPVTIHATSATGMQGQHRKGNLVSPSSNQQQPGRVSDKSTV